MNQRPKSIDQRPTKILSADADDGAPDTRTLAKEAPALGAAPDSVDPAPASGRTPSMAPRRPKTLAAETEAQIRHLSATRIGFTALVLLAIIPVGFVTVFFARAPWVSVMGAVSITLIAFGLVALRHYGAAPPTDEGRRKYHLVAFLMTLAAVPLIYVMGTYTSFVGVLCVFVLLYNMSAPPKYALLMTSTAGVSHLVLYAAVATDTIPDLGVLSIEGSDVQRALGVVGLFSAYTLTFVAGQAIRRRTQKTLTELRQAAQQVALREAVLREARLALQEAGGIGQTGRFSDQVFGNYEIGVVIGRGGMGEVYEAKDVRDESPAAVKLLRPPKGDDDRAWQRFEREAQIVASLSSPNVVRVLAVGDGGPFPFIAMERLCGRDLSQLLREERPPGPRAVAEMVLQCAEGLWEAHGKAVVHRDVKPHNLFRCDDGVWKVLDFGVARLFDGSQTVTHNLVGTPAYMAPEQLREDLTPDHRTDIHGLAVVAYRVLTGHPAFAGRDMATVLKRVSSELPRRPSSLARVPPAVCDVLRVALAKDPNDRFDDILDFARSLARAIRDEAVDPRISERAALLDARRSWS